MLKSVTEITGGLPILTWEGEGGAVQADVSNPLASNGYSQEELYFYNRNKELKERLQQKEKLNRPERPDAAQTPGR
jgi:hypothetical protein